MTLRSVLMLAFAAVAGGVLAALVAEYLTTHVHDGEAEFD